nr:MAG TPA: hypothetical protein [Caudoviricetes sp.]
MMIKLAILMKKDIQFLPVSLFWIQTFVRQSYVYILN